ncbi:YcxB family protein [Velocimicrobium porci]|uniref:YcxB family protein n=1 Tax=Velocimicrobium porci TaxID=2606634 RepID=A0A6L5Y3S4_9FIRM|nr:YcxB family protein [Velocimicrobium porci]MSS64803.1 YcxB family protein [Velocimicrobium porci]
MNQQYQINTTMEREDYRNFLYLITFRKNPSVLLAILLMSFILSFFVSFFTNGFQIKNFLIITFFMFLVTISTLCLRLESKVKKKYSISNQQNLKKEQTITLFSDSIEATNRNSDGTTIISYNDFYEIWETRNYLFFYFSKDLCSLIRKQDIDKTQANEIIYFLKSKLGNKFK